MPEPPFISAEVTSGESHDTVIVFVCGEHTGELLVDSGLGDLVARALCTGARLIGVAQRLVEEGLAGGAALERIGESLGKAFAEELLPLVAEEKLRAGKAAFAVELRKGRSS